MKRDFISRAPEKLISFRRTFSNECVKQNVKNADKSPQVKLSSNHDHYSIVLLIQLHANASANYVLNLPLFTLLVDCGELSCKEMVVGLERI